ncbi:MAG: MFS transporter [Deltaproteobacteria bacterium]|nr:MFS transporter [Deltaproteobacteria bacterium]
MAASKGDESRFFYGYMIVLVSFTLQVLGWGLFNSFGVFFKPIIAEFAWQRAVISSAISVSMLVFGIAGILQGRLSDRFGPRMTMTAGGILLGAGYFFMSQVATVRHLYVFCGLFIGLGISGTDVVLLSTTARWFVKKRGMMTGVIKVGTGVGMLIMPLVINRLITAYGWRTAFFVLGAMVLFFYVSLSQFLVRDPGKMGLAPDGEEHENPFNQSPPEEGMTLQEAARTVQFWTICFAFFLVLFCAATILMHIVTHAIDLGISPANAAKVLSGVGAASIAGRFVMGSAGDRIGNKSALVICFLCLVSSLIWLQLADKLWMLFLFAIVYGFAHGGFYALIAPLIADLFGTSSHGVIFGIVSFASTIGGALGPVTGGYIFDITGSYGMVFWILTTVSIVGLIAAITLKPITSNV